MLVNVKLKKKTLDYVFKCCFNPNRIVKKSTILVPVKALSIGRIIFIESKRRYDCLIIST